MKMNLLMMLSGLAARAFGRRRPSNPRAAASWYDTTPLGDWCGPDTHCAACGADGDCDPCDTIDGRRMDEIAEHAQTCDGCGNLTENESLTRSPSTDLLYCRRCHAQGAGEDWAYKVWECGCGEAAVYTDLDLGHQDCPGCGEPMTSEWPSTEETVARHRRTKSPHRHGWYSTENDRAMGHYHCTLASGGTVMVTNVTISPTGGLAGWPDAVYMGEVVPEREGGIARVHEPFGIWTPPWVRSAECENGTCGHEDMPCADRRQANLIRRFQAATWGSR